MAQQKKRNGIVDVLRVVFALIVLEFHFFQADSSGWTLGKIGVEFFVILSGFLFYGGYMRWFSGRENQARQESLQYVKQYMAKRYFRFFWYSLIAFVFAFLVIRIGINADRGEHKIMDRLSGDVWEILLVKSSGLNRGRNLLNGPAWTLSSMLIAEFFILSMLTWGRKFFLSCFMPLSILFGMGYWINMPDASQTLFLGLFTFGTMRVYLLTCFGIIAWYLCQSLKRIEFTKFGRILLCLVEWTAYLGVLYIAYSRATRNWQYCCIAALVIAFAISFSGHSFVPRFLQGNKFTNFLGDYSLGIYLVHHPVTCIFKEIWPDYAQRYAYEKEYILICMALALAYTLFMRLFIKLLPKVKSVCKRLVIAQAPAEQ